MNDIILSKWQWVTVFFSVIAFMAMIVGRYPIRTTLKSGIIAFLINFAVVSFMIYVNISTEQSNIVEIATPSDDKYIEQRLVDVFEENKDRSPNKELVGLVEPLRENDHVTSYVYVKNFHEEWDFYGKVRVAIYDDDGNIMTDEVFDISLDPGEKKQIDNDFGDPSFAWFRYEFYPEGN
ncbi:hypothetical protein [Gracilibacillus sp. HCP3S3_G5_2]